ncbi:RNA polymerase sigma factor [Actibacterium sp. 188UL27-1]|nr:RNA polymerase sigma factor [Actibacterium sp. 188UL27-1]
MSQDVRSGLPDNLGSIWRFALALSGDATVADDLTQSTCLRAIEKAGQFRVGTNLTAWLLTICRSIWLNQLRAQKIRITQSLDVTPENLLCDMQPEIETHIFAAQVFSQVMQLPEAQRETVLLVYVEGFGYREAAGILDIPIGTVMSRLATARRKLADLAKETSERPVEARTR